MTSGGIYLMMGDGLVELSEVAYETEDILQGLLADYPKLLAGEQINSEAPRRWVLVRRESAVPDSASGGGRWSLDHLFLDQEGVPTLVEVKRSTDTRIRREVVGQMLDYAANAVAYWPVEKLISEFEATCQAAAVEADEVVGQLVGDELSVDEFWQRVKVNLQAGRIRMIFVADVVPPELRRIVEFLNEQLDPAEMYAVEVRRFAGAGATALVPQLIGSTAEAQRRKGTSAGSTHRWTEDEYFLRLEENLGSQAVVMARAVLTWARERGLDVLWGRGATGSMRIKLNHIRVVYNMFNVYADGRLELPFGSLKPPYDTTESRQALLMRLNETLDGEIPDDAADKFPQVSQIPLRKRTNLDAFLSVWADFHTDVEAWADREAKEEAVDGVR